MVSLSSYVGFDTITQQIERKLLNRGFEFNLMVLGQQGLGKSTLVNSLFSAPLKRQRNNEITATTELIEENGVRLKLTLIDTPYAEDLNNEGCIEPILKYIKDQYALHLRKERSATRDLYAPDKRVHCCLFVISPFGNALKPLDVVALRQISSICNVVLCIGKSDTLTLQERQLFKRRVQQQLEYHKITLFPQEHDKIREMQPFAVIGSESTVMVDGHPVRGRKTKSGTISIENEEHSEFVILRNLLMRTHLYELVESTNVYYEAFRTKQLMALKDQMEK